MARDEARRARLQAALDASRRIAREKSQVSGGGRRRRAAMQTEPPTKPEIRAASPEVREAERLHDMLRVYVEGRGMALNRLPSYQAVKRLPPDEASPVYIGPSCSASAAHQYYDEPRSVRFTADHTCVICKLLAVEASVAVRKERMANRKLADGRVVCLRCGEAKSPRSYGKRSASPDGKSSYCLVCARAINRETYRRRKEREAATKEQAGEQQPQQQQPQQQQPQKQQPPAPQQPAAAPPAQQPASQQSASQPAAASPPPPKDAERPRPSHVSLKALQEHFSS